MRSDHDENARGVGFGTGLPADALGQGWRLAVIALASAVVTATLVIVGGSALLADRGVPLSRGHDDAGSPLLIRTSE